MKTYNYKARTMLRQDKPNVLKWAIKPTLEWSNISEETVRQWWAQLHAAGIVLDDITRVTYVEPEQVNMAPNPRCE